MSDRSTIEWTQATWNCVTGCTRVSEGCDHCYIPRTAAFRIQHRDFDRDGVGATTGVKLHPDRLHLPLRWREPRRVFVNSLSDLFHAEVPDRFIAEVFAVMAMASRHQFQVLTKRPGRMRSLLNRPEFAADVYVRVAERGGTPLPDPWWPLPNLWLGASVENQRWADIRVPALLDTLAAVRFLSCEPLLGPVDLHWCGGVDALEPDWCAGMGAPHPFVDWVIIGGESGPGARPMHLDWAQGIVDQCRDAGVAAFVKQLGSCWGKNHHDIDLFPEGLRVREYPTLAVTR